jgi:hypothetical protein
MTTSEQVRILATLTTRDEAGRHFSGLYDLAEIEALENDGLIEIGRPVHCQTGIPYSIENWTVEVTDDGQDLVDANPEDWPTER